MVHGFTIVIHLAIPKNIHYIILYNIVIINKTCGIDGVILISSGTSLSFHFIWLSDVESHHIYFLNLVFHHFIVLLHNLPVYNNIIEHNNINKHIQMLLPYPLRTSLL